MFLLCYGLVSHVLRGLSVVYIYMSQIVIITNFVIVSSVGIKRVVSTIYLYEFKFTKHNYTIG